MPSSPPLEAQHFRGKSLSPESPVPVHIPEPQNIPVLQNQIDPIFNLVSTHMDKPVPGGHDASAPPAVNYQTSDQAAQGSSGSFNNNIAGHGGSWPGFEMNTAQQEQRMPAYGEYTGSEISFSHEHPTLDNTGFPTSMSSSAQNVDPASQSAPYSKSTADSANAIKISDQPRGDSASTHVQDPQLPTQNSEIDVDDEGVNYQTLLDNLTPTVSIPPTAESHTSVVAQGLPSPNSPRNAQTLSTALPVPAGLPARPPPQEKPAIHPNYSADEDIRAYHNPPAQNSNTTYNAPAGGPLPPPPLYPPQTGPAPNGMNPPPLATFQQSPLNAVQSYGNTTNSPGSQNDGSGRGAVQADALYGERNMEPSSAPDVEGAYQEFLREEAKHTSQGQWERFPAGSRLFVGNLFTEKVTKRDLFLIFHKYGRLAQISMKSAYGFIQYVQAADCSKAMQMEQGLEIKGRKINLEISKPQRNARNAAGSGDNSRGAHGRRSRSPDHKRGSARGNGGRANADRYDRGPAANDLHFRGRDDYRPQRSPSPRGFRGDSYRTGRERSLDRYYGARRSRSRSPYGSGGIYRERSPRSRDLEDEASLPIARRPPGTAPDVQIILAEEVDRTFTGYIQSSFRERSLRCDALQLPPRVSMSAVVKRQIMEGVQAVVKIFRRSQVTGKIPLQVFNRSQGYNNVQFDEYEDLDATVAAEIVVRAKSTHAAPPQQQVRPQYVPPQGFGGQQYGQIPQPPNPQQQPSQVGGPPPNVANLITSMDGPSLQKLLSSMAQSQQPPPNPINQPPMGQPGPSPDLSALLSSVTGQHNKQPGMPQPPYMQQNTPTTGYPAYGGSPPQQYQQANVQAPLNANPALSQLLGNAANRQGQPGMPPGPQQQNVQDIMAQLARYK